MGADRGTGVKLAHCRTTAPASREARYWASLALSSTWLRYAGNRTENGDSWRILTITA